MKKNWTRSFARYFWGTGAALLIALALLVQAGRTLLPMANDYRPQIAKLLGERLGVSVEIGHIQGQWVGLRPQLQLHKLQWKNKQGETVLSLGSLNTQFDLPRTLMSWRLVWSDFSIDELSLSLQEFEDGQIYLKGVLPSPDDKSEKSVLDPMELLLLRGRVELSSVAFQFHSSSGQTSNWQLPTVVMENTHSFHRLQAQLNSDDQPLLNFVFEGEGDPRDKDTFLVNSFLHLNNVQISKLAEQFAGESWQKFEQRELIGDLALTGKMWAVILPGGYLELQGSVQAKGGQAPLPETLELQLSATRSAQMAWQLNVQNISPVFTDHPPGADPVSIGLSFEPSKPLTVQLQQLDLGYWYQVAHAQQWLGEGRLKEVLSDLNPRGKLENIKLTFPRDGSKDFLLQANLNKVAADDWQGAPAVTGVDGYLETSAKRGFVDLKSQQGFSMHYTTVYEAPQVFERISGQVQWTVDKDSNSIYVNSGPIRLEQGDTVAMGYMRLYTPWHAKTAPSDLILYIGLQNDEVSNYPKYLPKVVASSLTDWIASTEASGQLKTGAFIYRGGLVASDRLSYTTQLALDLDDVDMSFLPDWPRAKDISAQLEVDDLSLLVEAPNATLSGLNVEELALTLENNPEADGDRITIAANIHGASQAGINFLLASPIAASQAETFAAWRLAGQLNGRVDLKIPLDASEIKGSSYQVDVNIKDNHLSIPNLALEFDDIAANLHYDGEGGIRSEKIEAQLWGQTLKGELGGGAKATRLSFQGQASNQSLALWMSEPGLLMADGLADFNASLILPSTVFRPGAKLSSSKSSTAKATDAATPTSSPVGEFILRSNLEGLSINLPAPYGKSAGSIRPLYVSLPLGSNEAMNLRYALDPEAEQQVQLKLAGDAGQRSLSLSLDGTAQPLEARRANIGGHLESLALEPWLAIPEAYQAAQRRLNDLLASTGTQAPRLPVEAGIPVTFKLRVDALDMLGFDVPQVTLAAQQTQKGWLLDAQSEQLTGQLEYLGPEQSIQIRLQHLVVAEAESETDSTDKAAGSSQEAGTKNWDFSSLQNTDVTIDRLVYGDKELGEWKLRVQAQASGQGLLVDRIYGALGDIRVGGLLVEAGKDKANSEAVDPGASILWNQGSTNETRLNAFIRFNDINQLSKNWQMPSLMESKSANFNLAMNWPNSPLDFDSSLIAGSLDLDVNNGRFFQSAGAGGNALLRLLSVLNFDTWVRRLQLDFADLYKEGMVFDRVAGHIDFHQQQLFIPEPILVEGPTSKMQFAGKINWQDESLDTRLVATLPVGNNVALATGLLVSWPAAAGVYLASKLFSNQVDKVASVSYSMTGDWADPKIKFEKLFDSKAAKKAGSKVAEEAQDTGADHSSGEEHAPEASGEITDSASELTLEPGSDERSENTPQGTEEETPK